MRRKSMQMQEELPENWACCGGAYVLLIRLRTSVTLPQKKFDAALEPGLYAYCGSAKGPGGLGARLSRHLSANKMMHWHVDHLTHAGDIVDAAAELGGCECGLVKRIQSRGGTEVPLRGLGSSDCKECASHLIKVPTRFAFSEIGLVSCLAKLERHASV